MNFDKEGSKFENKMFVCVWRGGGGGGGGALTPKMYAKLCQFRSNTEIQLSTQCRACSKINISKSKNSNFELSLIKVRFHVEVSTRMSIWNTQILHCTLQ